LDLGREISLRAGADEFSGPSGTISTRVFRLDPGTGARTLWKEIEPITPTSGGGIGTILLDGDGAVCVYTHQRYSSDQFLAEGLED
jgi:hypothetical protein